MRDHAAFLARLRALDAEVVAAGMPAISARWWQTLDAFEHSARRRAVIRKGRRVGASTIVVPRLAVGEALFGGHLHTPGAPPLVYAFVSVRRGEAANRLRGVRAVLETLRIPFAERGESIELRDLPAEFRVVTSSHRAAVGETVAFAWLDEVSRWVDVDTSTNPASETVAALAPALATLPDARMWLVSSPLGHGDFHARSFAAGHTDVQFTDSFSTWEANPQLSEAQCRALEPDPRTFDREYGAIPSSDITESWFGDAIDLAIDAGRRGPERIRHDVRYTIGVDQAFERDCFGWSVCSSEVGPWDDLAKSRAVPRMTVVHELGAWKPDRSPREMARRLRREVCDRYHTRSAYADQHSGLAFRELAQDVGVRLEIISWTGSGEDSKAERFKRVRLAMYERALRIPDDAEFLRELRSVRGTILPSGSEKIEVPRTASGHGDRVSAMVLGASVALSRPPQLPPSRMTDWERRERHRAEAALGIMFSPGNFLF